MVSIDCSPLALSTMLKDTKEQHVDAKEQHADATEQDATEQHADTTEQHMDATEQHPDGTEKHEHCFLDPSCHVCMGPGET